MPSYEHHGPGHASEWHGQDMDLKHLKFCDLQLTVKPLRGYGYGNQTQTLIAPTSSLEGWRTRVT